jgi:hypothetical protein
MTVASVFSVPYIACVSSVSPVASQSRRATIGSTRVTRRAGRQAAAISTSISMAQTPVT